MKLLWYLCISSNLIFLNSCSTLFSQTQNRSNDLNNHKRTTSFFDSLFQDNTNNSDTEQETSQNKERTRTPLSQETISNQNKRNSYSSFSQSQQQNFVNTLSLAQIDGNTWRTSAHPAMVFGIMSRLLSQSYIISSMDRKNFNIQTDWDKFFIDGRLFRNRISIMVFPVGPRQTEVIVKNIVEYFTGSPNAMKDDNNTWLPSPDITDEIKKLVDNTNRQTALILNQQFTK